MKQLSFFVLYISILLALPACHTNDDASYYQQENRINHLMDSLRINLLSRYDSSLFCSYTEMHDNISHETLYRLFFSMPKGGSLHNHISATFDIHWAIDSLLQCADACIYLGNDNDSCVYGQITFWPILVAGHSEALPEGWFPMQTFAENTVSPHESLYRLLTLGPEDANENIWEAFEKIFWRNEHMLFYKGFFEPCLEHSLNSMAQEGLQFVEIRTSLDGLYVSKNLTENEDSVIAVYQRVLHNVKQEYPSFDLSIIISRSKNTPLESLSESITKVETLASAFPERIVGFDLVSEEATSHPLSYYSSALSQCTLPLILHAGESNDPENTNIATAIELGTKRIGHGLNLHYFPELKQKIKEKDIPLEVCPLSNLVLGYVTDLRNHPAKQYLADSIPIILASDDNAFFKTAYLTDDYLAAYLSWDLSLSEIRHLMENSILYASCSEETKAARMTAFHKHWKTFLQEADRQLY